MVKPGYVWLSTSIVGVPATLFPVPSVECSWEATEDRDKNFHNKPQANSLWGTRWQQIAKETSRNWKQRKTYGIHGYKKNWARGGIKRSLRHCFSVKFHLSFKIHAVYETRPAPDNHEHAQSLGVSTGVGWGDWWSGGVNISLSVPGLKFDNDQFSLACLCLRNWDQTFKTSQKGSMTWWWGEPLYSQS